MEQNDRERTKRAQMLIDVDIGTNKINSEEANLDIVIEVPLVVD